MERAREHEEFREFVAARSTALLQVAVLLTGGDRHAAEDLLQTALLKAYGRWKRIDQPEAYLRQVMYRQQVNRWRLRRTRAETTVADLPELGGVPDGMQHAELRVALWQALGRLTPRQRTVVVLRYFEDLPESEVAALLGLAVGTVRSTSHRSLAKLRDLVPELDPQSRGPLSALTISTEGAQ